MDAFIAAADEENLEATPVATVTKEKRLRMKWRGDLIVDLSREFLNTNGVTATASVKIVPPNPGADYRTSIPGELSVIPVEEAFVQNLGRLEVAGQKGLVERFDSTIGAATVLMPSRKYQLTPEEGMVAEIPVLNGNRHSHNHDLRLYTGISRWSPFHGAVRGNNPLALAALGGHLQSKAVFQNT